MRTLLAIAGIIAFLCSSPAAEPKKQEDMLASLNADDSVLITFTNSGCFHHSSDTIYIQKNAGVTATAMIPMPADFDRMRNTTDLKAFPHTSATLTERAVKGLDNYVRYYRTDPGGGCTTVTTVTIRFFRKGKHVRTEEHWDATCSSVEIKNSVSVSQIHKSLKERR
jgi:hypothetical protein